MAMSWKRWCSLCGWIPPTSTVYEDLRQHSELMDLTEKLLSSKKRRKFPVCVPCKERLQTILDYTKQSIRVQSMLNALWEQKPVGQSEIMTIRNYWLETEAENQENPEEVVYKTDDESYSVNEVLFITREVPEIPTYLNCDQIVVETVSASADEPMEVIVEQSEKQEASQLIDGEETKEGEQQEDDGDEDHQGEVFVEEDATDEDEKYDQDDVTEELVEIIGSRKKSLKLCYKKCRHCPRKFRTEAYLKAHERSHNTQPGQLPYSCEQCPKRFRGLSGLMAHVVVHSDDNPYQCDKCEKSFKNVTRLKVHLETHAEDKRICDICGLALNTSHSYNKHKLVHSNTRPHKCPVCPKDFKKQTALKEHLISHTGMRPYSCPFCDKTFINGSSSRLHKIRNHPQELEALEASGMSEEVNAKHRNLPTLEELKQEVIYMMENQKNLPPFARQSK